MIIHVQKTKQLLIFLDIETIHGQAVTSTENIKVCRLKHYSGPLGTRTPISSIFKYCAFCRNSKNNVVNNSVFRIRTDPRKEMPPGFGSAWTDADPDPGAKKA